MAIEDKDANPKWARAGEAGRAHAASVSDQSVAPVVGPDDPRRFTDSGIEVKTLYTSADLPESLDLGAPGEFPYTRGVHAEMYRKRTWTMRQYAGYASAKESNERYKYLLAHGGSGLSMAFDLPTQLGLDSDDPRSLGEVGRTGVAIDTLDDMRTAFDGIPLDEVSTSMTINAPAAVLLLLYQLVAEEQGVDSTKLRGTVQNDILKEYIARGNFIYPPEPSMRLTTDLFAYCKEHIPKWNTVSISGYHFREKGASAVQEVAFTLASGMAYVQAAIDAGLKVDDFAPRLAFFFNGHNNVFQEVAKFRAARNMWAHAMQERFGAQDPKSLMLRFHTQTGGVTLTAQQPMNNIVRVALQGFAAVCGGTQSLHTNGFDEALALPSERAAKLALRTQQVIAYESGATDTVDPFAGSYYVEALTAEIEQRAWALIGKVDEQGGSVQAITYIKNEIEESAFGYHERYRTKQDVVVGVNEFVEDSAEVEEILSVDPASEQAQLKRLKAFKAARDQALTDQRLEELKAAAQGTDNLLPPIRAALKDHASVGEVCGALRSVFGDYQPEI
ncbi:methylmalonyl-CoA mutase family protein [Solirubrobacter phytolaccae]|uniref:Methylmalonyl-CoA mutase family protein n=1 Tax=Solirubrobacter phytolaccae TaxID=1404360 RepID=A0A9X3NJJ3_9ACTN|nr:methylmalonyl-CoA mutase family protein [Solirubrobacter phytolaccae]MDA0182517.1 methylmalonyl-CoA mutase family protein [Solirubrobacter phytolaccae]